MEVYKDQIMDSAQPNAQQSVIKTTKCLFSSHSTQRQQN